MGRVSDSTPVGSATDCQTGTGTNSYDSATQKRRDAKQLIDELKQLVSNDGGQWNLGRTKLTRAHLDAVFLAFGKPKQTGKMQDLVQPAQEMLKWDAGTGIFGGVLGWDDDRKHWVVLSQ